MRPSFKVPAMLSIGHLPITAMLEEVLLATKERLGFLHIEGKADPSMSDVCNYLLNNF